MEETTEADRRIDSMAQAIARADGAELDVYARGVSSLDAAITARQWALRTVVADGVLDTIDVTASPLSYLNPLDLVVCERVSTDWRRRVRDKSYTRELGLYASDEYDDEDLTLWQRSFTDDIFRKLITKRYVFLEELFLVQSNCDLYDINGCLAVVAPNCPSLKELTLYEFDFRVASDVPDSYHHSTAFAAIANFCRSLATLSVTSCTHLETLGPGYPSLTSFELIGVEDNEAVVCTEIIEEMVSCCPILEKVDLNDSYCIGGVAVESIGRNCERLKKLNLRHCHNITDAGLNAVAAGCPLLQCLDIEQMARTEAVMITDESMTQIATKCTALTWLDICSCSRLTGTSFEALATLPSLTNLRAQDLPHLADHHVSRFLAECHSLQRLEIGTCSGAQVCPLISSQLNAIARSYAFAAKHDSGRYIYQDVTYNFWRFIRYGADPPVFPFF